TCATPADSLLREREAARPDAGARLGGVVFPSDRHERARPADRGDRRVSRVAVDRAHLEVGVLAVHPVVEKTARAIEEARADVTAAAVDPRGDEEVRAGGDRRRALVAVERRRFE